MNLKNPSQHSGNTLIKCHFWMRFRIVAISNKYKIVLYFMSFVKSRVVTKGAYDFYILA